jgi:hypothetical protein
MYLFRLPRALLQTKTTTTTGKWPPEGFRLQVGRARQVAAFDAHESLPHVAGSALHFDGVALPERLVARLEEPVHRVRDVAVGQLGAGARQAELGAAPSVKVVAVHFFALAAVPGHNVIELKDRTEI